mmetsp:Transcript_37448/g.37014  ORF Transcript_37448/g.37014 Transcript_37448/m.37014 type:complete len:82 (-) Transcript_37448:87-332(-)
MNIRKRMPNQFESFASGKTLYPQSRDSSKSSKKEILAEKVLVKNFYKNYDAEASELDITIPQANRVHTSNKSIENLQEESK